MNNLNAARNFSNATNTLMSTAVDESPVTNSDYQNLPASMRSVPIQVDDYNPLMQFATIAINSESMRASEEYSTAVRGIADRENGSDGLLHTASVELVPSNGHDDHLWLSTDTSEYNSFHSSRRPNEWTEDQMQTLYRLVLQLFLQNGTLFYIHQRDLNEINAYLPHHFENYQSYLESDVLAKDGALTKKGLFWIYLSMIYNADPTAVQRTPAALCRRYKEMKRMNKLNGNGYFRERFLLAYPFVEPPRNGMVNLADAYATAIPRKGQWTLDEDRMVVASITAFFAERGSLVSDAEAWNIIHEKYIRYCRIYSVTSPRSVETVRRRYKSLKDFPFRFYALYLSLDLANLFA